ncbi:MULTISPECIES: hydroxyacid dehydrogenase [unclassified Halomonas]|uniref:hydroxyacid dehydrogenase n=1 Tax=unclassified Halomonas TaxID=2609666 RepID=UPI001CF18D1E|nr:MULTISPECIES: hydroxyacid dehydrogenase [unclassified Halomonas]UZH08974.1 hydroxyacid dehydrogenase [Halomonas sp. BDJS001]
MSSQPVILVTGPYLATQARELAEASGYTIVHTPPYPCEDVLKEYIDRHDPVGVVSRMGRFTANAMAAGKSLKVISKHGAGVDNIDVEAATAHNIQVIRASGANAVSVAEQAIALIFATVKQVVPLDQSMREGRWEKANFEGRELAGMRLGLIGAGAIACATGRLARGIGLELSVYDPYASDEQVEALGAKRARQVEELLQQSDIVSLHCPLTQQTHHLLDAARLSLMPKGSFVINTARGGLIDEQALLTALESGQIAGAGLDTFEEEPPTSVTPLMRSSRVVLSPHIGGATAEAGARVGTLAVAGIVDMLARRTLPPGRLVNDIVAQSAATTPLQ